MKGCLLNWSILAELLRAKALKYYTIKIIILGKGSTTPCVLIGPMNLYKPFQDIEYLVFPYVEE